MSPLKLALVGTGNVAESYVQEVRRLQRAGLAIDVAIVCGRTLNQAHEFIGRQMLTSVAREFETMLASPDVHAVMILSPAPNHALMTHAALTSGKHVFCEKTLASNAAEARELAALASENQLLLYSAPATPLSPVMAAVHQHICSGDIGRPHLARGIYGWAGPDWADWFYAPDAGPLRDLGTYALTSLTVLLGPVSQVHAMIANAEPTRPINGRETATPNPDTYQLSLTFHSGCIATLATGFSVQKHQGSGLEIFGDRGSLQLDGQDWEAKGYRIWTNAEGCWRHYSASSPWNWTDGLRDFCESLVHGHKPALDLSQAMHVLDVIDAAMVSGNTSSSEKIESTFVPPKLTAVTKQFDPHRIHKSLN